MSNPTPPNPFLEPEDSAGKKPLDNPFAVPSPSPVPESVPNPVPAPAPYPALDPTTHSIPEVSDYAEPLINEEDVARGGKIYRFSWFKGIAAVFFLLVGIGALDDAEHGAGLFFLLPSAWYLFMSWNNRGESKVAQKRYWPLVWTVAVLLLLFV
ncbi:hypothetical protein ACTXN7_03920 [Corynebacterium flavescens]|uniref:Uncharacterized protein n=4 Tax=Corynebacterium flavescens TaxID=28028 RepID=A0AB73B8R1_CORFL|nr:MULTISPECIES: hypothetical protein [Corynebacterium]KAA8724541.1 hypothetical protein F4V60_03010 [Corynebacterium flavescens]MDN6432149.1 hypothetical protein [Corynebacterium flavescens]MDN6687378.1 hypothetical protein [Corynebacterium flavescens]GEB97950.1 hypothetical protein CFL01nite_14450 [Corynebacterium flavescens]HCG46443.1 hypothetical protein [Corynebacterium flavescens]